MLHIRSLSDGLPLFKALGSEVRVEILRLLMEDGPMSMHELAGRLKLTNGAMTNHIRQLEGCGLVITSTDVSGHGNQKFCTANLQRMLIDCEAESRQQGVYQTELGVGHYQTCEALPACGLASTKSLVGEVDDPRYFAHPDRYDADVLWFSEGYVEYEIPNFAPSDKQITQLVISMELGSKAPDAGMPSDIRLSINEKDVGVWNYPGGFDNGRGLFTPDWWYPGWNQHGCLKLFTVNREGAFIDGQKASDVTVDELSLQSRKPIPFRLSLDGDGSQGGLTIFGKSFGNYRQGIRVEIGYTQ